jgi:hypothetical protein
LGALAVVAVPSGVVAEGCYCAPADVVEIAQLAQTGAEVSAELIPFDAVTSGTSGKAVEEPASLPLRVVLMTEGGMSRARPAPGESPADVLWCASPDDPRCSPRDGQGSELLRIFGQRAFGSLAGAMTIPSFEGEELPALFVRSRAARGVRARVDRPPRA